MLFITSVILDYKVGFYNYQQEKVTKKQEKFMQLFLFLAQVIMRLSYY